MKHKRYLFNCLSAPRKASKLVPNWWFKRIERNPGDLAYEYAVMNALALDEKVEFLPTGYYYYKGFTDAQIDRINATYDAFICPLADVFSDEYLYLIRRFTELIRRLRIPCVVPCVGLRATEGVWSAHDSEFDKTISAFIKAVLDKSSILGVRGETTARHLEKLGFSRGRHFEVIGCPSMYTYGARLPERALRAPSEYGQCAFSLNQRADERGWLFIDSVAEQFREAFFVSQNWSIFQQFMLKRGWRNVKAVESQPVYKGLLVKYAEKNRVRFFLNRKPWLKFLGNMDLYFGHRIHGACLSILAGTPAFVVPFESRTEELAQFHGIPMIRPDKFDGSQNGNLDSILSTLDFAATQKRQKENFENWLSFLHTNNLETIFDSGGVICDTKMEFPLERTLPDRFQDDNLRAWKYNSPLVKARLAVAFAGAKGREVCAEIKGKIVSCLLKRGNP